jgi:WD40 repeat protein
MFRWLAICLLLCAAAVGLVALAAAPFSQRLIRAAEPASDAGDSRPGSGNLGVVTLDARSGMGSNSLLVIPDGHLTAVQRREVPSEREGRLMVVGRELRLKSAQEVPPDAVKVDIGFLVVEVDDQAQADVNVKLKAESDVNSAEKKKDKFYRRWRPGELLPPGKLLVVKEDRWFSPLQVGDVVSRDEVIAHVNATVAIDDVAIKVAKLESAEAAVAAATKTKDEAEQRAITANGLYLSKTIALEEKRAADFNYQRYKEEEKTKIADRRVADRELNASLTTLRMHEIKAPIDGVIKAIYHKAGEAVKAFEPVVQIQDPGRMRVECLVDVQDAQKIKPDLPAFVEPTQLKRPLVFDKKHQGAVTCVAVTPGDKGGKQFILSGSEDKSLIVWEWNGEKGVGVSQIGHGAAVRSVACAPNAVGRLAVTGDNDGVVSVIDLDRLKDGTEAVHRLVDHRHKGAVRCVAFSPDGAIFATGGDDHAITLWKSDDRSHIYTRPAAHNGAVTSLQFAADGRLISAGRDGQLTIWKVEAGGKQMVASHPFPTRSGDVWVLGVSPDGKRTLFDQGAELRVLSLTDESHGIEGVVRNPSGSLNFTTMALFAPDGKTILTNNAPESRVQLWRAPGRQADAVTGRAAELRQFRWDSGAATCAAFDPDSKFVVTGTQDDLVLVWPMPSKGRDGELLDRPVPARLTLVEGSLDSSSQVRVWADMSNDGALTPGGKATLVVPLTGR